LTGGVELCEFQPSMLHTKLMVVDGIWTTTGSINFVNRSMEVNEEGNIVVLDRRFAEQAERIFQADAAQCEFIEPDLWRQRGALERLRDGLFWLVSRWY
jgi:cardiolipin synthase